MYIQHNITAMETNRFLGFNGRLKQKSIEKLSTGYRVNRAADDAAGLTISEKMRAQIRGLHQGERNVEDGISFVQTADGALSEIHGMMHRIHELAVQAANDTNTAEDRKALDEEIQQYKEEIDYIFRETEFNTIKIWDTNTENKVPIGVEKRQALEFKKHGSYQTFTVTEVNKGAIAYGSTGYTIEVQGTDKTDPSTYGFKVKWEGWNKEQYESKLISWDDSTRQRGSFRAFTVDLANYLDTTAHPELKGIHYLIEWDAVEAATLEDVKECVDGRRMSSSVTSSETITRNTTSSGVSLSINTEYLAELASGRDVDHYDTVWIEPVLKNGTNVIEQPSYNNVDQDKGWKFRFQMPGIGTVTASSSNVSYWAGDRDAATEHKWWEWNYNHTGKYAITYYPSKGTNGSLARVTDSLTASRENGLWNAKTGGTIRVNFTLTADKTYNYKGRSSTTVGSVTMDISVKAKESKEELMKKLKNALNNAVLDAYEGTESTNRPYTTTAYAYDTTAATHLIDTPVYKTNHDRVIQAGANAGQLLHICYDSLRLLNLGIQDSNVLTRQAATQTITDIQAASDIVSGQRSLFGAYENRMEHAKAVDAGTAENLQAAESRIRDVDMADEMVGNAKLTIMEQAMQAMLANANQQTEGVLALLQG